MKQLLFIIAIIIAVTPRMVGQPFNEKDFTLYTKAEGLSNNTITGIAKDVTGYLWLSTSSGINRYDGTRFKQFYSQNDSVSVLSDNMYGMTRIDNYRLGVYSAGLYIIDTRTEKVTSITIPCFDKQYQYKFNSIVDVKSDKAGNIFIGTRSGFYQYDKDLRLVFRYDHFTKEQTRYTHFHFARTILALDDKRLIVVSSEGLYIYAIDRREFKKMQATDCLLMAPFLKARLYLQHQPGQFFIIPSQSDSLIFINIAKGFKKVSRLPFPATYKEFHYRTKLFSISDSVFYLTAHKSGFYKLNFNPASGDVKMQAEKILPRHVCLDLLKDKFHNLWIATNKGLLRYDPYRTNIQQAVIPSYLRDSLPTAGYLTIDASTDIIYTGGLGLNGLLLFNKKSFLFLNHKSFEVSFKDGSSHNMDIQSITPANAGHLLLAANGPLLLFNTKQQTSNVLPAPGWNKKYDWACVTYRDSRGIIWISGPALYQYDPYKRTITSIGQERLARFGLNMPVALQEDGEGNVWMAGHGLVRYNVAKDSFDRVLDSFPYIRMPNKQVNTFTIDRERKMLWFTSMQNGLISYDIRSKKYRHFTSVDGLPNNYINSLIIVGKNLWIAGNMGIACMDLTTLQIVSFGKEDGFPDLPILNNTRFFYDSIYRQLYLGISDVLVRFDPHQLLLKRPSPHIFIEELVINERKINVLPGAPVTTNWNNNDIRITIGNINFYNIGSQNFAYNIHESNDTLWQQLGHQTSFSISNLSPGSHHIQVKSFSQNNRWPEQLADITIIVLPPFWQNAWFIVPVAISILGMIYLLINWRTRIVRRHEMEKTNTEKLKTEYYRNQYELEQISNFFSSSIADKKTIDDVLWNVAQQLSGRLKYVDFMIYLWNEDKTKMIQKAAYGPKGTPQAIENMVFDVLPGQGVVGYVIQTKSPILIPDTRKDPRYRVDEKERLSEICVPIIHNDELIGIIDSEHDELAYFNERDLKILTTIATLLGNKIKQIESNQSLQIKQEELALLNTQLAEARLSALQAQMNPHFIFNALNSIKRMILDDENEKASIYLSKFAEMIRMTLDHSKDIFTMLNEAVSYLETYLEMEQLRFNDTFNWYIFIDEDIDTDSILIPALMIQPLVENAIWHGLKQIDGNKEIRISFGQDQEQLICSIKDNGIGIRKSEKLKMVSGTSHRSVGLENLRNRIRIMNEKFYAGCSLDIIELQHSTHGKERGTLVTLRVKLMNL